MKNRGLFGLHSSLYVFVVRLWKESHFNVDTYAQCLQLSSYIQGFVWVFLTGKIYDFQSIYPKASKTLPSTQHLRQRPKRQIVRLCSEGGFCLSLVYQPCIRKALSEINRVGLSACPRPYLKYHQLTLHSLHQRNAFSCSQLNRANLPSNHRNLPSCVSQWRIPTKVN